MDRVTTSLMKYVDDQLFPFIDDVSKYEKVTKIGQGTFGEVFKARCKTTGQLVALKKILMENEKEGFPITALREIKMLQKLKHVNVTELIEICCSKGKPSTSFQRGRATFYLVFKFYEHDLAGLLSNSSVKFNLPEIKTIMKQMFDGLYFIHCSKILHRDMKAANVLLTKSGVLKLADFGLARPLLKQQEPLYTNRVVTLWYRPPELLLGERAYTPAIDCWGAGCIMAEMWTKCPIMQGDNEQKQLSLISQLCGSIHDKVWPKVAKLPLYGKMELRQGDKRRVKERLSAYVKDQHGVTLIDNLLKLDPETRFTADQALNDKFFWSDPMPGSLERVLRPLTTSNFEYTTPRHNRNQRGAPNHPRQGAAPQGQMMDRVF